jgi:hypothetical protein
VPALTFTALALGGLLASVSPAAAGTLPCPGGVGDPAALAQAILNADVIGSPATITLAAGCTYTFTAPDTSAPAASVNGKQVELDDWWGPDALPAIATSITIDGHGAVLQRSPSAPPFRFFFVGADPSSTGTFHWTTPGAGDLTLEDLTLSGGDAVGGSSDTGGGGLGGGGAIYNQGSLTLDRVTLSANAAQGGSGGVGAVSSDNGGGIGASGSASGGGGFGGGFTPPGTANVDYSIGDTAGGGAGLTIGEDGFGQAGGGGGTYGTGTGGSGGEPGDSSTAPCALGSTGGCGGDGSGAGGYNAGSQQAPGGDFGAGGAEAADASTGEGGPGGGGGAGGGGGGGAGRADGVGSSGGGGGGFGGGGGVGSIGGIGSDDNGGDGGGGGFGGGGGGGGGGFVDVLVSPPFPTGVGGIGGGGGFGAGAGSAGAPGISTGSDNESGADGLGGGGAGMGGALFDHGGSITILDSTLTANSARGGTGANPGQGLGGAVFVLNGAASSVRSSTIDANTADAGGALEIVGYDSAKSTDPASVTVQNSILAGTPGGASDLVAIVPTPVSQGQANIDGSHLTVDGHDIVTNLLAGAAELTGTPTRAAPGLAAAAFNGGPGMRTLEPTAGSPALGTGDPSTAPPTDERGAARPSGGPTDVGAVQISGAPPTAITIVTPAPAATYAEGAAVKAKFSCSAPAGVSVDSCTGPVALGAPVSIAALGAHTFTVTTSDSDGRTTHRTITYTVAPGAAQLKPLLRRLLSMLARSRKLLRSGRASLSLAAPSGGSVTLSVSSRGRSKRKALAGGHARFSKAGTVKLTIRLSRAARKALRGASSVKVDATASYTVAGLPPVKLTAKLKLRR